MKFHWAEEVQYLYDHVEGDRGLNIGCGIKRPTGFLNLDCSEESKPDVVHDLEYVPLPFDDNSFDAVFASHVLEHIYNLKYLVDDLIRISENGAYWEIHSPVGWRSLELIDHKRIVSEKTFRHWFPAWNSNDAKYNDAKAGGFLMLERKHYNRDFKMGPISAYHFRKYLGIEPLTRRRQLVLLLKVVK